MPTGCPLGKKDHEFGDCIYLGECEDLLYFNGIYKCKDCNLGEKYNQIKERKELIDKFKKIVEDNSGVDDYGNYLGDSEEILKELEKLRG